MKLKEAKCMFGKYTSKRINHEEYIQRDIASYLNELMSLRKLLWCHVPNESGTKANIEWYCKRKRLGVKAGFPDLIILGKDHPIFIELKYNSNKTKDIDGMRLLSCKQLKWRDDLKEFGYNYYVVCVRCGFEGVNEVEKILKEEGIL